MKQHRHIEIVRSGITSLSSMGEPSAQMIQAVLEQQYDSVGITQVNDIADLEALVALQPDLVFLGMKYIPLISSDGYSTDTNIWLSGYLEAHGINYTGSPAAAIALDFDKAAAKRTVQAAGLLTADYFTARPGQFPSQPDLPLAFPLFMKPPAAGGGQGIAADSVIRDFSAFQRKVQQIADDFQSDALVETYLPGREFSVAIMAHPEGSNLTAMPIELIADANDHGDRILGQAIKAADTERVVSVTDLTLRGQLTAMALEVFTALGARDYGRIDVRLDNESRPYFLEANLIPGLAFHEFTSYFTAACKINGQFDYPSMISQLAAIGLSRQPATDSLDSTDHPERLILSR